MRFMRFAVAALMLLLCRGFLSGVINPPGGALWQRDFDGQLSPMVLYGGRLYFNTLRDNPRLYCLDALTGKSVWEKAGSFSCVPPVIDDGSLYISTGEESLFYVYQTAGQYLTFKTAVLYRLDALTGKVIMKYNAFIRGAGSEEMPASTLLHAPLISGGTLYFSVYELFHTGSGLDAKPSFQFRVRAVNKDTGAKLWDFDVVIKAYVDYFSEAMLARAYFSERTRSWALGNYALCLAGGRLYFGLMNGKIYCLDAGTGKKLWEFQTMDASACNPIVTNGRVYFAARDWQFYCLDAANGKQLWKLSTGMDGGLNKPVFCDNRIYFTAGYFISKALDPSIGSFSEFKPYANGYAFCLDAASGKAIWKYRTGTITYDPVFEGESIGFFDVVSFTSLDMKSGKKTGERFFDINVQNTPVQNGGGWIVPFLKPMFNIETNTDKTNWYWGSQVSSFSPQ